MGYTTEFDGYVSVSPPLNPAEVSFLTDLANTRRMHRTEGPLFVTATGFAGQDRTDTILDYNSPDPDQPGLWCQWEPSDSGTTIQWDGGEKFYAAAEWMKYLVTNLFAPTAREYVTQHAHEDPRLEHFTCDHTVNGFIDAQGEEPDDRWRLIVRDNVVMIALAEVAFLEPEPI